MTTNDIEKAEILLCCKNGENLLGVTDDKVLLSFIAQYVKFIQIDEEKIKTIPVAEIIKKSTREDWLWKLDIGDVEDVVKNHTVRKIFIPFQKKYKQKHYNVNPYDMTKTYYAIIDEEDVHHICVECFSTLEKNIFIQSVSLSIYLIFVKILIFICYIQIFLVSLHWN